MPDQFVVQIDGQVGGKSQRPGLVDFQRIDQRVFLLEQRGTFRLDVLPELVHLGQVNHARGQVGFEQVQCAELQQQCVLGIADLLQLLQQTDEAADRAGTSARKARSATGPAACRPRRRRDQNRSPCRRRPDRPSLGR